MTAMADNDEHQLALDLDNYVRLRRNDPQKAAKALERYTKADPDSELVSLCNTYKDARESAIKSGYIDPDKERKIVYRKTADFPWGWWLMLLMTAFMLLYSTHRVATLKRDNMLLQKEIDALKGN